MKKILLILLPLVVLAMTLMACAADNGTASQAVTTDMTSATPTPMASEEPAPNGVPARPGSGATGDPSANLADLIEVSGVVKEVKEGLVLISQDGGDFMLRFSENSKWADGVDTKINTGNTITCLVKPEPTFTTPSQGEVFKVLKNVT